MITYAHSFKPGDKVKLLGALDNEFTVEQLNFFREFGEQKLDYELSFVLGKRRIYLDKIPQSEIVMPDVVTEAYKTDFKFPIGSNVIIRCGPFTEYVRIESCHIDISNENHYGVSDTVCWNAIRKYFESELEWPEASDE